MKIMRQNDWYCSAAPKQLRRTGLKSDLYDFAKCNLSRTTDIALPRDSCVIGPKPDVKFVPNLASQRCQAKSVGFVFVSQKLGSTGSSSIPQSLCIGKVFVSTAELTLGTNQ